MTIENLYGTLYNELVGWCASMYGNEETAEDLVQEGFMRAIVNSDIFFSMGDAQQRSWLYRTIKNLYIDRIRRSAFETPDDIPETADISDDYDEADIRNLLGNLPDIEGAIFDMRYFQGYTSSEIGRIFGLPAGTIRYKLSQARNRLRKMLE